MSLEINNKLSFKEYSKSNWEAFGIEKSNKDEKLTTQQMADQFFGGKPLIKSENYEVYTDKTDPIKEQQIEEVLVYKYYKGIFGDITVKLFASKDGVFLLERYRQLQDPTDKTIVLFMEIDDKYNLHTVMRMKVSKDLTDTQKVPFAKILDFVREHSITISPKEMRNLIEKKVLANKKSFLNWLMKIIKSPVSEIFDFFEDKAFDAAAKYFDDIATGIESLKIEETGWNPKTEKGEYNPALIPESVWQTMKPFYEHKTNDDTNKNVQNYKKVISDIFDNLFGLVENTRKNFTSIIAGMEAYLPKSIYNMLSQEINKFFNKVVNIKNSLRKKLPSLEAIIYRNFTSANALVCGIYNSLIDIIASIFSLIGFFFKAKVEWDNVTKELSKDPYIYVEYFLEIVEGIIESVRTFDIIDFFVDSIVFQAQAAQKLYQWLTKSAVGVTLEQVFYYLGYIIGMIIDIVLETLLTGGVADVVKLFEGVTSFMKNPLQNLSKSIARILKTAGDAFAMGIEFIRYIIKKLKEGSKALFEQLSKWIDDIFSLGGKVKNFVKDIYDDFFSPKVREYLEKIGLHPTKYEDGVFNMCPIS
ncbi:hypothetical protein QFZ37_000393 [Chryseobacterium ginsenosidimutans]|uniref:hypothetical protein n=1 Tax=Chryseobacterium ginsenosidimutans TaxID=687846 RepID=UPI00278169A3|nr:hypothetical protein [Chryseobacterium ginsenosidimutans]MDQ0592024.1 hypothetical protein [Chryseobacterium ginsenosidimutans]